MRVQMGGRTARATTNRLDDESLRRVVRQAEALARVQEEDAELLPMLTAAEQGSAVELDRYCEETAAMGAGERAEQVAAMVAIAKRDGLNAAGIYSCGESFEALVQLARGCAMAPADAGPGIGYDAGQGQLGLAEAELHQRKTAGRASAGRDCRRRRRDARRIRWNCQPGKYTVILEPSAVVDLIGFLAADFSGLALLEQRSCLNRRLGTKLFGENISIARRREPRRTDRGRPLTAKVSRGKG